MEELHGYGDGDGDGVLCMLHQASALPWLWILHHLLDIKDVATPILKEILTYIPDVQKNSLLEKRIALRYLEEVIASGQVDAQAIPLVVALLKDSTIARNSDLVLRVQTEAVLTQLRRKPRRWRGFSEALDHIFPDESEDARLAERRQELLILLQTEDQDKSCLEILKTYSIDALRQDLLKCITLEKAHLEHNFFSQLLQDVFEGKYPLSKGLASQWLMKMDDSKLDLQFTDEHRKSVGSDDTTVLCDRNLHDESEEAVDSEHEHRALTQRSKDDTRQRRTANRSKGVNLAVKKACQADRLSNHSVEQRESMKDACRPEEGSIKRLREIYEDNTVKSSSPLKSVDCTLRSLADADCDRIIETTAQKGQDDSLDLDLLDMGSDGHKELCCKCNKPGTLVKCDGCPIAVHAKCLASNSNSLIVHEFFCPLCVQKKAAEAVTRALQEEMEARQRLADFLASASHKTHQRLSRNSTLLGTQETDCRPKNAVDLDVAEATLKKPSSPEPYMPEAKEEILPREPNYVDIEATFEVYANAKAKDLVQMSKRLTQEEDGDGHDGDLEEGSDDIKIADDSDIGRVKSRMKLEASEGSYERPIKHRIVRGNRIVPGMRRKRLAWTKAEEDKLKAGVKKFSHQWTRILEFGQGKFHPSRTGVDLKDKWRNLEKVCMFD